MSLILSGTDGLSDVDGSAATPAIRGTDANTGIFFPAADTIAFSEGGVESMRIDANGNVAIGVTSVGGNSTNRVVLAQGSDSANLVVTRTGNESGALYAFAGSIFAGSNTNHPFVFTTNTTERMRIDTSGNVGIGTISPLARLHIEGNSTGAVQAFIENANGSTNSSAELVFGTWSGSIPTGTGNPGPSAKISAINIADADARTDLVFSTYSGSGTSAERMRILNTGNILSLAGGSTTATGTGIAFPATQNASSNANTLDDYEEGTWTPTVSFGGTGATLDSVNGLYRKIGSFVYLTGIARVTNKNGGTGSISVGAMPFNAAGIAYAYGNFQADNLSLPTGAGSMMPFASGSTFRVLYQTNTAHADLQGTQVIPNCTLYFFVVYSV
jgi:hypothetical protein